MKTYNHLWEQFISEDNFKLAYKNSIKRKKKQKQIIEFNKNPEVNLENLRQLVISGKFHTSKYKEMMVHEPKERIIYKLPYCPDRIVQHAIMNILKPILINRMIQNTYACIEERGQLKASQMCMRFARKYKYCLKCDIKKFYPSINQNILSNKFHNLIHDEKFLKIIDDIIFSFDGGYNCPIGNYCSQWFGNYYLSFLDNFIYHKLKCHAYLRYCDDFILYSNDKKYLQNCKNSISIFLKEELDLKFSKAQVFDIKQGIDFCGYRHFKKYILIRKSTSKRIQKRLLNFTELFNSNKISSDKFLGSIASANGIIKHCNGYNFRNNIHLDYLKETVMQRRSKPMDTLVERHYGD